MNKFTIPLVWGFIIGVLLLGYGYSVLQHLIGPYAGGGAAALYSVDPIAFLFFIFFPLGMLYGKTLIVIFCGFHFLIGFVLGFLIGLVQRHFSHSA